MGWAQGDFNFDGTVDYQDLGILATWYNMTNPTPPPGLLPFGGGEIPEPATLALLAMGAVGLIRRRR